jgi:hypothetical protein
MVSHAHASSDGSESISSIYTRRSVNVCVDNYNSRDFFRAPFRHGSEAPVSEVRPVRSRVSTVSADQALLAGAASTSSQELVGPFHAAQEKIAILNDVEERVIQELDYIIFKERIEVFGD